MHLSDAGNRGAHRVVRHFVFLFVPSLLIASGCTDATEPPLPAALEIVAGAVQSGEAAGRAAIAPSVRVLDQRARPMVDVRVTFTVVEGDGHVATSSARSDASGQASADEWTLGTRAGRNTLNATVSRLAPAVFTVNATAGRAAKLTIVAGDGQTAIVGGPVGEEPVVRVTDVHDNAVAATLVRFGAAGGSHVRTTVASTDANGIASSGTWTLGTKSGEQVLEGKLDSGPAVVLHAVALPGPAAGLAMVSGDGQSAIVGTAVSQVPTVRVVDMFGNAVSSIDVGFAVGSGGGVVTGSRMTTDHTGVAAVLSWKLGAAQGINTLTASVADVGTVTFTATATTAGSGGPGGTPASGGYHLEIRFTTGVSQSMQSEFHVAGDRWSSAITGDLPDVPVSLPANACGMVHPAIGQTIDDLLILVRVGPLDGPGNVLGSAGPCVIRSAGGLPVIGVMNLDADDLAFLEANGRLGDVIAHEIGHIIGIGTRWGSYLAGGGGTDPHFTGPRALAAFAGSGGFGYTGAPVPVENTGGPGTRDSHWRESVLTSELMTGWLNLASNPLSNITIAALADIGYTVNVNAADGYGAGISDAAHDGTAAARPAIEMKEAPIGIVPIALDARGRRVPTGAIQR